MPLLLSSSKQKCYAVVRGKVPGIYRSWEECSAQVTGWPNALFKSFRTEQEARTYVSLHTLESTNHESKDLTLNLKRPRKTQAETLEPKNTLRRCSGVETGQNTAHLFASANCVAREDVKHIINIPSTKEEKWNSWEDWCKMYNSLLEKSNILVQEVYVDGACRANGMAHRACAGYGGFYGCDDDTRNFALALPANEPQTNNRGELRAVIHAIEQAFKDAFVSMPQIAKAPLSQWASQSTILSEQHQITNLDFVDNQIPELKYDTTSHSVGSKKLFVKARNNMSWADKTISATTSKIHVYFLRVFTDSKYVVDGLGKFSKRWVKNGFKLVNGKKVRNEDLWKRLIELRDEYNNLFAKCNRAKLQQICKEVHKSMSEEDVNEFCLSAPGLELVHVRGHSNVFGNVKADALAVQGATMHNEKTKIEYNDEQRTRKNFPFR